MKCCLLFYKSGTLMPQKLPPYHKIMRKQTMVGDKYLYGGFLFAHAQVST